ncbi:SRPBCC family protein [Amycolatopsis methanolica]|uniref:Carbon monoxide dehydrogenase subunit G n=1 Tax=Amycolatopsis methanolica 239 TaxID=1068978 RepID=A0A076MX31_AMYME|nr:SRPBCC family protein [Amycolatopsis methanolica]AIJ25469.1 carbon monoxide dehydrogenase subunit G [Amycolatopsis methanolica 239]
MRLDHEFTVPAPPAEVWKAVTDPERVAPCMPGATLTKVEGETFTGTVKVKLGPISLLYKGSGEFLETDEQARKIVIKASGKDSRGAGTAAATVTVTLSEENGGTKGSVATDLNVTGRPAQFGRGMISEVGGKILDQFATNLADRLGAAETSSAPAEEKPAESGVTTEPAPEKPKLETVKPQPQEAEAIDLFEYAGGSIGKRLAPVLAGVAAVLGIVAIVRLIRRR